MEFPLRRAYSGRTLLLLVFESTRVLLVRRPVVKREVHGGNVLVAKHHSIVGQKKIVTMVEEGVDVQLCVKDIGPITNHRAWPWALGAASVSEVDCNAMTLPSFTRGADQETVALNALVVGILRGVENVAQLSSRARVSFSP